MNRWHLLALVALVGTLNIAISAIKGMPINLESLVYSSLVASLLGAIVLVFDLWLWRIPFLHPWFVAAPNLNGRWRVSGDIKFLRTGTSGIYQGIMTIKQGFFSIRWCINWYEEGGETRLLMKAPLAVREEGFCAFSALYEYTPKVGIHVSETHRAGFFFHSQERLPQNLTFYYSTVDMQIGKLVLERK